MAKRRYDPEVLLMSKINLLLMAQPEDVRLRVLAWLNVRHGVALAGEQPRCNQVPLGFAASKPAAAKAK